VSRPGEEPRRAHLAGGSKQKTLAEMSVEERNRFADELKQLTAPALANRLFALLQSKGDPGEIDLAWRLLVPKLQTELTDDEKKQLYSQIQSLLTGIELKDNQKLELVQMLGSTATPEALGILLQIGQQNLLPDLQEAVNNMIGSIGDVQWGGRFHEELSPMLERAWETSDATPGYKEALAKAIAGVGARSGIELLYAEAARGGKTVSEFSAQENNMTWHVLDVFQTIRNPDAVPVLATRLAAQPLDNLELVLSGASLASMGRPEATSALLHWAESSPRDVGQVLEPWLSEVRDPDSLELLKQSIGSPPTFKNPENWKAVDRALQEWKASRATTSSGD